MVFSGFAGPCQARNGGVNLCWIYAVIAMAMIIRLGIIWADGTKFSTLGPEVDKL